MIKVNPKDRGTKKWTSMWIPEHVAMLKRAAIVDERTEKPLLDEYEIEDIEAKIHYAMEANLALKFRYWRDGFEETLTGRVHYIDPISKQLRIIDSDDANVRIDFAEIVGVEYS